METNNNKGVNLIRELYTLLNDDAVKNSDIKAFLDVLAKTINIQKAEFANISTENIKTIQKSMDYFEAHYSQWENQYNLKTKEIQNLIEYIKTIKPEVGKDGKPGKDGEDSFVPGPKGEDGIGIQGEPGKDGSPDTRLQIVEKINTGEKKDLKISVNQVEGIEKLAQTNFDRAIGILNQRTSFLINKGVKHDTTLSGDGTDASPLNVVGSAIGVTGYTGYTGANGSIGATGYTGYTGANSTVTGPTGYTGYTGPAIDLSLYTMTYDGALVLI